MAPFPAQLLRGIDFEPVPCASEAIVGDESNILDPSDLTLERKRNIELAAHTYLCFGHVSIYSAKLRGPFTQPWSKGRINKLKSAQYLETLHDKPSEVTEQAVHSNAVQDQSSDETDGPTTPVARAAPQTSEKDSSSLPTPSETGHRSVTLQSGNTRTIESPTSLRPRHPLMSLSNPLYIDPSPAPPNNEEIHNLAPLKSCLTCGREDSKQWRKGPRGPGTLCVSCSAKWVHRQRQSKLGSRGRASRAAVESSSKSTTPSSSSKLKSHGEIYKLIFPKRLDKMEVAVHGAAVDLRGQASLAVQKWARQKDSSGAQFPQVNSMNLARHQSTPRKRRRVDFGDPDPRLSANPQHPDAMTGSGLRQGNLEECMSTQAAMEQAFEGFQGELESPASKFTGPALPGTTNRAQNSLEEFGNCAAYTLNYAETSELQPVDTQDLFDITEVPTPGSAKGRKSTSFAARVTVREDDGASPNFACRAHGADGVTPLSPQSPNKRRIKSSLVTRRERNKDDLREDGSFDLEQIVEQGVGLMNWS